MNTQAPAIFTTMLGGDVEIPTEGYFFIEEKFPSGESTIAVFLDGRLLWESGLVANE